jgi:transposase
MTGRIRIEGYLSVEALRERYRGADDSVARSHFHIIWLMASGNSVSECAAASGYTVRWIEKLVQRYNAGGPDSLGDRRRANKGAKPLLTAEQLASLAEAVASPPPDGGLWTGPKVAAWMARETGRDHVHPQRGWVYLRRLDHTWQTPRPRHEQTATPEEQEAFKKNSAKPWIRRARQNRGPTSRSGRSTSTGSA